MMGLRAVAAVLLLVTLTGCKWNHYYIDCRGPEGEELVLDVDWDFKGPRTIRLTSEWKRWFVGKTYLDEIEYDFVVGFRSKTYKLGFSREQPLTRVARFDATSIAQEGAPAELAPGPRELQIFTITLKSPRLSGENVLFEADVGVSAEATEAQLARAQALKEKVVAIWQLPDALGPAARQQGAVSWSGTLTRQTRFTIQLSVPSATLAPIAGQEVEVSVTIQASE